MTIMSSFAAAAMSLSCQSPLLASRISQLAQNSPRRLQRTTTSLSTIGALPTHHRSTHHDKACFISYSSTLRSSSVVAPCMSYHYSLSKSALMSTASRCDETNTNITYILRFDNHIDKVTGGAGVGIIIYDSTNGRELWSGHGFKQRKQDNLTKNVADYMALNDGLQIIQLLSSSSDGNLPRIEIQTSNGLISKQLNGEYRVSSKALLPWYRKACKLIEGGDVATVKVDKAETKLAKQKAISAVEGTKSDENYKNAFRDIISKKSQSKVDEDSHPLKTSSISLDSSADVSSMVEPSFSRSNCELDKKTELSNSTQSISAAKTYILRFDGGSRGNPGIAGAGMVLYDSEDGSEVWSGHQYLGDRFTNNEAEYTGLITGLQCARSLGVENIVAQGDSKLILQQVEGKYKVKAANLQQYHAEATLLSKEFASFQTNHIERARNARADELANRAMDTRQNEGFNIQ